METVKWFAPNDYVQYQKQNGGILDSYHKLARASKAYRTELVKAGAMIPGVGRTPSRYRQDMGEIILGFKIKEAQAKVV
jgi:hypothetical protein